jgi:hypothetical protein
MKKLLLLPIILYSSSAAFAQTTSCAALQTENAALKEKIVAYEARLGIGVGGVSIEDGDPTMKVKFLTCKASKATHRAVLTYQVTNSGEPVNLAAHSLWDVNAPTMIVDEQGQAFKGSASYYQTVGVKQTQAVVPSKLPLNCTYTFLDVPPTTTRLNAAVLSFVKGGPVGGKQEDFKTTIKNIPVTWGP